MAEEVVDHYDDLPVYQDALRDYIIAIFKDGSRGDGGDTEFTYLTDGELKEYITDRCPTMVLHDTNSADLIALAWATDVATMTLR